MAIRLFRRKDDGDKKSRTPEGMWIKCAACLEIIHKPEVERNLNVCPKCNYHFRIPAMERIRAVTDEGTFQEFGEDLESVDMLAFTDTKKYTDRLKEAKKKTGRKEAVITGIARINGIGVVLGVLDFEFLGGSLGRGGGDAGGNAVADADGEDQRGPGKAVRCETALYQRDDRPHHGRSGGELLDAGRHHHIGARRPHRVRRSPRHRADDQAETSGGLPTRRVSSGARDGGHDRRADETQAVADADSPVPGAPLREMRNTGGPRGPGRIRPGLERIRAAFGMTGHPERAFRTVHIAGTNGKGSTACFTEAILRRMLPEPVGLYTSPHLLSPEERIRVGGERIPSDEFARCGARVSALSRKVAATTGGPLSDFQMMTWIAW